MCVFVLLLHSFFLSQFIPIFSFSSPISGSSSKIHTITIDYTNNSFSFSHVVFTDFYISCQPNLFPLFFKSDLCNLCHFYDHRLYYLFSFTKIWPRGKRHWIPIDGSSDGIFIFLYPHFLIIIFSSSVFMVLYHLLCQF